jgi:hypothetical protein
VLALIIWGVDNWFILEGQVTTEPGKRLATFVTFCAGIMLIVGLMSLFSLGMSTVSHLRLKLLLEEAEVEEAAEENVALIDAVADALPTLAEDQREAFVRSLTSAKSLEQHPDLAQRIKQELALATICEIYAKGQLLLRL